MAPAKKKNRSKKKAGTFQRWLARGVESQLHRSAYAEIYEISGPDRKRSSAAGGTTAVGPLLDPRLKLSPQQRAVGQAYGGFYEAMTGTGSDWFREFVDGGGFGGGGYSEAVFMRRAMVELARTVLDDERPVKYFPGNSRRLKRGRHRPIQMLALIDAICVSSRSVSMVAIVHGWVIYNGKVPIVPSGQRKKIATALRDGLDIIGDAWYKRGYELSGGLASIECE